MIHKRLLLCAVFAALLGVSAVRLLVGQASAVHELAPGVFFRQSGPGPFGSNSGWIEFDDYVLVVDASYPAGARHTLEELKKRTQKPVRFIFDTHHHGDHAFGNPIYTETGAVAVAQEEAVNILRENGAKLFSDGAAKREDFKGLTFKAPTLAFPDRLIFDDGKKRVELIFTGWGHTRGDAVAWLPKEKILFTGDACVNGAFNFMGDGNSESWIRAIEKMQTLDVALVAPGHGPVGKKDLLETQKQYFVELRRQVGEQVKQGRTLEQVQAAVKIPMYEKWTGKPPTPANIAQVFREMTAR